MSKGVRGLEKEISDLLGVGLSKSQIRVLLSNEPPSIEKMMASIRTFNLTVWI